jgi:uncharacterized membrane protein
MPDIEASPVPRTTSDGMVTLTHIIYGLHAFSAVTGIATSAFVVTAFLTGWPSILAVILNYVKRNEVEGTYLASHFTWQIRTFWFALLWAVIAVIVMLTFIGIPFAYIAMIGVGVWVLYRIIRGWLALIDARPMPLPR